MMSSIETDRRLLTATEAARVLGVSPSFVGDYRDALGAETLGGGLTRYPPDGLVPRDQHLRH